MIVEQMARLPSRAYASRLALVAVFTIVSAIAVVASTLAR